MKKHLALICIMASLSLTVLNSCGDSKSSSDSLEVLESSISETTTEEEIEPETRNINPLLDKTISCDYLNLCMPSKWNPEISTYDGGASIFCEWEEESEIYDILFFVNDNAKMENEDYKDYSSREILNQFISYGQEYTITKSGSEGDNLVFFFNDKVNGSMSYPIAYEDIVMYMIESIEFY